MATRSTIAKLNPDHTVTAIYVHWDGYIHHNGQLLKDHYTNQIQIDQLIALGALNSLAAEIGEQHDLDSQTHQNWCKAYGRDGGEHDTGPFTYASVHDWLIKACQEYNYLWDGAEWHVTGHVTQHELRSLTQVILESE